MENAPLGKSNEVSPREIIKKVAAAMPDQCKQHVVVIGSLAAGYHFFQGRENLLVQTKDIDCLLHPRVNAVQAGEDLTNQLLRNGWKYHPTAEFPEPGNAGTPIESLPVVRLSPPGEESWFIELLTVPEDENDFARRYVPLETAHGRFSLCSLGGIALAQWCPTPTEFGIAIARPEMMALANLLHHPRIGDEPMAGLIRGRSIKRSNKDLGRVLALAYLAENEQENALLEWAKSWQQALEIYFPTTRRRYAAKCGTGLRDLLASRNDFEEAHHSCQHGLVAALHLTEGQLRVAGERLLVDAVETLEKLATEELTGTERA